MQTVVELPSYCKVAAAIFTDAERNAIVTLLAADPEAGVLIPGTGGIRKVRVSRRGMGKRGGARVIYIVRNERSPIFLLDAFTKNEKSDLTQGERNLLRKRVDELFQGYGR